MWFREKVEERTFSKLKIQVSCTLFVVLDFFAFSKYNVLIVASELYWDIFGILNWILLNYACPVSYLF